MNNDQEIIIPVPIEYNFDENLKYLGRASNECLFHIKNQRIYKAIPIEQEIFIIEIRADNEKSITIRFVGTTVPTSKRVRAQIARYVREWFDLDLDLVPFYKLASQDSLLNTAITQFYGLRIIGIPDLFEALCWGIIGQQINLTYAYTLKRRFVESFGKHVDCEGGSYWIFPTPQEISELTVEDMTSLGMTIKKCEYVIDVAKLMTAGLLTKEILLNTSDCKTSEKILVNIRGIGPWTANYVLMRCLKFSSAFPIDDVGLHNAIKYLLDKDKKPTKEEILQLSTHWAGWEAYATFYLWRFFTDSIYLRITRLRPSALAIYNASSTRWRSDSILSSSFNSVTPRLIVIL